MEASGVGLHSGVPVRIRILPAPVSTGIVFVRTDLDNFTVPASWRHVARVSYATSLMRQGVLISTTEHLLSVFYSMGIDNAYVEIDNLEVPILDGSGLPFVRLIEKAGIRQYRRKRRYLRIRRPISVEDKGKRISIIPVESFRLTCDTDYPAPVGRTARPARSALRPGRRWRRRGAHARVGRTRHVRLRRQAARVGRSRRLRAGLIDGPGQRRLRFGDDLNPDPDRRDERCARHGLLLVHGTDAVGASGDGSVSARDVRQAIISRELASFGTGLAAQIGHR